MIAIFSVNSLTCCEATSRWEYSSRTSAKQKSISKKKVLLSDILCFRTKRPPQARLFWKTQMGTCCSSFNKRMPKQSNELVFCRLDTARCRNFNFFAQAANRRGLLHNQR